MQRCCSGAGRAHTQAPSAAASTAAATAPGQPASRGGSREDRRAAWGAGSLAGSRPPPRAAATCPGQHPSSGPGRFQLLLSPPSPGAPRDGREGGRCDPGLGARVLATWEGLQQGRNPGRVASSPQPHGGRWDRRSLAPRLCGWPPAGPWQAEPGQDAAWAACPGIHAGHRLTAANTCRKGGTRDPAPGPQCRTRRSLRPGPGLSLEVPEWK